MSIEQFHQDREAIPSWLANYEPGLPFDIESFLMGRVVYYPGSGTDGQPVKLFGSRHRAHSFVYADYGHTKADVETALDGVHGFDGYSSCARIPLERGEIHTGPILPVGRASPANDRLGRNNSFGFVEEHGPIRLAILFLGADAFAAYQALFCHRKGTRPYAIVCKTTDLAEITASSERVAYWKKRQRTLGCSHSGFW